MSTGHAQKLAGNDHKVEFDRLGIHKKLSTQLDVSSVPGGQRASGFEMQVNHLKASDPGHGNARHLPSM
jgi:hypothetical protein